MKKIISILLVFALVVSLGATASLAKTTEEKELKRITKEEEKEIRKGLQELKVSEAKQNKLIDKLNKGEVWDAHNLKKLKEVEKEITPTPEEPVKIYEFEDGSILRNSIEIIEETEGEGLPADYEGTEGEELVSGQAKVYISSSTSGSGYVTKKARVESFSGAILSYFHTTFTIVNNGYDYINSVYDRKIYAAGYTFSVDSFGVTKKYENADGKARAALRFDATTWNGWYSTNWTLRLNVGSNTWSASYY